VRWLSVVWHTSPQHYAGSAHTLDLCLTHKLSYTLHAKSSLTLTHTHTHFMCAFWTSLSISHTHSCQHAMWTDTSLITHPTSLYLHDNFFTCFPFFPFSVSLSPPCFLFQTHRQRDRQTDRQRERQTHTDTHTDRHVAPQWASISVNQPHIIDPGSKETSQSVDLSIIPAGGGARGGGARERRRLLQNKHVFQETSIQSRIGTFQWPHRNNTQNNTK